MSVILDEVFVMVLGSSQPRNDGCNFSRFNSISDVMEKIHIKLTNSSDKEPEQIRSIYHELDKILNIILLIWDDHFMTHSNIPTTYNDIYTYEEKPKDRSIFERIIRHLINDLFSSIDAFIHRLSSIGCDLYSESYRTNRQLIHSVLQIALQLPLEEMFEVRQTNPDLPLHISVQHNVDSFIKIYIWIILIILKNKDFVKIIGECNQEHKPIDISGMCTQAVSVFLEERRKRNEALIRLETDEKQILIQFLDKKGFDINTIYIEHPVRCFADCGNIYTKESRGSHKCVDGKLHYKTKSTSLSELRPTDCCLNCEGTFYAYMECGHIVCEKHIDPSKSNRGVCYKCSTKAFKIELNF
jgi:hypothetical protein